MVQVDPIDDELVIVRSGSARRADGDKPIIDDDEMGMNDVELLVRGQSNTEWPKGAAAHYTFYVDSVHSL